MHGRYGDVQGIFSSLCWQDILRPVRLTQ